MTDCPPPMAIDALSLRFGTSSWAYEGWKGQIYLRSYAKSRFSQDCLAEYAAYEYRGTRLFHTVGIDHAFYHPALPNQLAHYATQVPDDFRFCSKVWEDITVPVYANLPRYGTKSGKANPRFLDASLCVDLVLEPTRQALGAKAGPFIFEFQRFGLDPATFLPALDAFLAKLPDTSLYAVEVRNPLLLGPRYRDILAAHNVPHVYNHWTAMPPLSEQHARLGSAFTGPYLIARLLTPLGTAHADAVRRYAPYDRLIRPLPHMRTDVVALVRQARNQGKQAYVLVNNRAEGNSPMTIQALADMLEAADGQAI